MRYCKLSWFWTIWMVSFQGWKKGLFLVACWKEPYVWSMCNSVSQVGVILHYSSLSTMLWLGFTARNIYKQVIKKPSKPQDGDVPPHPARSPMLRLDTHSRTHAHSPGLCLSSLFSVFKSFVAGLYDYFQTDIGARSMNENLLWRLKSTVGLWLKFIQNQAGSAALKSNKGVCLFNVMYQGCL